VASPDFAGFAPAPVPGLPSPDDDPEDDPEESDCFPGFAESPEDAPLESPAFWAPWPEAPSESLPAPLSAPRPPPDFAAVRLSVL
jgi:hypothetical protein